MRKFCIKCGKEESKDNIIIDNLCINCYVQIKKIFEIPSVIEITTCSKCGAIYIENRWFYPSTSAEAKKLIERYITSLADYERNNIVVEKIAVEIDDIVRKKARICADVSIMNLVKYRVSKSIELAWKKGLCSTCFKRMGGEFESVVQLRFLNYDNSIENFKSIIMKTFYDYVVEIEDVDRGLDIKVVSRAIARKIVDIVLKTWKYVKITESFGNIKKLKNGSRRGKLYISLRIINPREGDHIVVNGKPFTVNKVYDNSLELVDSNGKKFFVDINELVEKNIKTRGITR